MKKISHAGLVFLYSFLFIKRQRQRQQSIPLQTQLARAVAVLVGSVTAPRNRVAARDGTALGEQLTLAGGRQRRAVVLLADVVSPVGSVVELGLRVAVSEPGKAVAGIGKVKVVEAELLDGLNVVQGGAGPQGGDGAVRALLVPRAAGVGPDGAAHVVLLELDKVTDGLLRGRERGNVGGLEAVDELAHPVGLGLNGRQHGAVANGAVGAEEDQVVGHTGGGDAQVRGRVDSPLVLQVLARRGDDGEARAEGGIEASGTDQDIDGVLLAVVAQGALVGDGADLAVNNLNVGLGQRLEVVDTGRQTTAANGPVGDQLLSQEVVVELLLHLRNHVGAGLLVDLGLLQEDAVLAVEARLNLLAVLEQCTGLVGELGALLGRVDVLLQTLDGRDPGGLTDEGGDLLALLADGRQDLDTRRAVANQADVLAVENSVGVPVSGVQQGALVLVQTGDGGPAPVVEDAGAVDEDVAVVADNNAVGIVLDLDVVAALLGVPVRANDLVLQLDILAQAVLGGKALKIVEDVLGGRVDGGPVELGLEAPRVVVRGDIASAAVEVVLAGFQ